MIFSYDRFLVNGAEKGPFAWCLGGLGKLAPTFLWRVAPSRNRWLVAPEFLAARVASRRGEDHGPLGIAAAKLRLGLARCGR